MGCDIHAYAEIRDEYLSDYWRLAAGPGYVDFGRSYGLFGWFAGVRNYSEITPLSEPRGIPKQLSDEVEAAYESWDWDGHSASHFLVSELLAVDYDQIVEDRRVTRQLAPNMWSGACTCEPGQGNRQTLREFLGSHYFEQLQRLEYIGDPANVRLVFWFDN